MWLEGRLANNNGPFAACPSFTPSLVSQLSLHSGEDQWTHRSIPGGMAASSVELGGGSLTSTGRARADTDGVSYLQPRGKLLAKPQPGAAGVDRARAWTGSAIIGSRVDAATNLSTPATCVARPGGRIGRRPPDSTQLR